MTVLPAQLLTGLTEVRLPLLLLDQPGLLRKGRVLAERPYPPRPGEDHKWPSLGTVCAQKGPDHRTRAITLA